MGNKILISLILFLIMGCNLSIATEKNDIFFEKRKNLIEQNYKKENFYKVFKLIEETKKSKYSLTDEQKQYLEDKYSLTELVAEAKRFKNKFKKEYDPYLKRTIYSIHRIYPDTVKAYIIQKDKTLTFKLNFTVEHMRGDWMHPELVTFLYDNDKTFYLDIVRLPNNVKCNSYFCTYYEDVEKNLSETEIKELNELLNSISITYRVQGKHIHKDYIVTARARDDLKDLTELYYYLKDGYNL